ncbi:MAG: T9SS type A sorting domain-containing protein [Bacteroidota bacterium]
MKNFLAKLFLLIISVTLSNQSKAQWSNLISENVDGVTVPSLPTGFSSFPSGSFGFISDSTNSSDCVGASGLNNIEIRNDSSVTGDYILYFPSFSTVGKSLVNVSWNSRVSTHFLDLGSSINDLEFSTDGSTWNVISYAENAASSTWAAVNNGTPISLPSSALNKPSVQLRLNVHIVNTTSGTYRMDDILVAGYQSGAGIADLQNENSISVFPNPSSANFIFVAPHSGTIELINCNGSKVMLTNCKAGEIKINATELPSGFYLIHFIDSFDGKEYFTKWGHF